MHIVLRVVVTQRNRNMLNELVSFALEGELRAGISEALLLQYWFDVCLECGLYCFLRRHGFTASQPQAASDSEIRAASFLVL